MIVPKCVVAGQLHREAQEMTDVGGSWREGGDEMASDFDVDGRWPVGESFEHVGGLQPIASDLVVGFDPESAGFSQACVPRRRCDPDFRA